MSAAIGPSGVRRESSGEGSCHSSFLSGVYVGDVFFPYLEETDKEVCLHLLPSFFVSLFDS